MQEQPSVNAGYAEAQWFKALRAALQAPTAADAARAQHKASRWQAWLQDFLRGKLNPGSRQPSHWPVWVTTEVLHGGFATQRPLAGGPLKAHEVAYLEVLLPQKHQPSETAAREVLNRFWSSPEAAPYLQECLYSRRYALDTPEEGALLVLHLLRQNAVPSQQHGVSPSPETSPEVSTAPLAAELYKTLEPYFKKGAFS